MKKIFTFFAAMTLLASVGFAQSAHRHVAMTKAERNATVAPRLVKHSHTAVSAKAVGDTISTFPWTEGFESATITGFSFVDSDNDGFNWERMSASTDRFSTHNGDGVIVSASYDNDNGVVLTPDNWMILPAFDIPTDASEFNLSWFEMGQDANYAEENYSVYICTTGRTVSDFTATTAVLTSTSTSSWVKKTVSLANYGGQTIFIAFRHHNSSDMFFLNIDDIRVGGLEPPEVILDGPVNVEANVPVTFTATGATTFTWTVDGDVQSETGDTLTYTFDTIGLHTVVASATNSAGTGSDSLSVNVYDCSAPITAMPWTETFDGNIDCWLFFTADSIDRGFLLSSDGYDDDRCLIGTYSDDVNTDQWAISPLLAIPAGADNYILKYFVYMRDWEGVSSHYQVRISTDGGDTSDFTTILLDETGDDAVWTPRSISLANYAGQTIRIAFHNITAVTGDAISFDAIYVGVALPPDMTLYGPENVIVGESYEWTAISDVSTFEWSVDGTTQSATGSTLSYTFTTPGNHTIAVSATNNAGTSSDNITVNAIECNPVSLPHTFNLATEYSLCWENNPDGGWDTILLEDGNYYLYSMSNLYGIFDLNPDNWIYTPTLTMPSTGSYEIAWKVMPYEAQLPSDHYGVYLVQGTTETLLYQETLSASITAPSQRSVTIPEGVTGNFKVAFRHYETTGGYVILVSDIEVVEAGTTVGIDDVENSHVAVYPNPANDMLMVQAENASLVQVLDVNGRVVLATERAGRLDISGLAAGVYVVRVVCADSVSTTKFVKE